jgi:hypothetical protein
MRFRLESLPGDIDVALTEQLQDAGHEPAQHRADTFVIGLRVPGELTCSM